MLQKFNVYEYPLRTKSNKSYKGSYTIKDGVKPLGFKGEKLVQSFEREATPAKITSTN